MKKFLLFASMSICMVMHATLCSGINAVSNNLHESSAENSNSPMGSSLLTNGDVSIDEYLKSYEEYVDKYISYMKRASNGDMTALAEYPAMMTKANELAKKLSKVQGSMSNSQVQRYLRIQQKLQDAAKKYIPKK